MKGCTYDENNDHSDKVDDELDVSMIGGGWFKGQEVGGWCGRLPGPRLDLSSHILHRFYPSGLAERRHNKESKLNMTTIAFMVMTTM